MERHYRRVLIKLSGGAMAGGHGVGFDEAAVDQICTGGTCGTLIAPGTGPAFAEPAA